MVERSSAPREVASTRLSPDDTAGAREALRRYSRPLYAEEIATIEAWLAQQETTKP